MKCKGVGDCPECGCTTLDDILCNNNACFMCKPLEDEAATIECMSEIKKRIKRYSSEDTEAFNIRTKMLKDIMFLVEFVEDRLKK